MTARARHQPPGRYRFRHLARMEWIKLRSLRSTWLTLALAVCASAGIALATGGSNTTSGGMFVSNALVGMLIGVLLIGVAGVLAILSLAGLFGLGLGAIIRHTAAAVTVVVGIVFVGGTFIGQQDLAIRPYLPLYIVSHSLGATTPQCLPGAASCWLSAWSGLGMLAGYAAIAMVAGALILARRDA